MARTTFHADSEVVRILDDIARRQDARNNGTFSTPWLKLQKAVGPAGVLKLPIDDFEAGQRLSQGKPVLATPMQYTVLSGTFHLFENGRELGALSMRAGEDDRAVGPREVLTRPDQLAALAQKRRL